MRHHTLDRRTLMQAVATFGCVTVSGLGIARAAASPEVEVLPLTGALVGWLIIKPDGVGLLNLVQMDAQLHPVRQVAIEVIKPVLSLEIAAQHSTAAAVKRVAELWGVLPTDCSCEWGRIVHPPSGRSIPFKIWTDFA